MVFNNEELLVFAGDKERVLSLPINEINDRTRTTIEKVQVGFLKFVARPLFAEWNNIHNSDLSLSLIKNIDDNLANWSFVQNKNQEIISTKAATAAPAINLKNTSEQDSPSGNVDRDVATVIVTSAQCDESSSGEVVQMHAEPPSSVVPNMPSVESMLDRPLKPPDLLSETSTVHLEQIGSSCQEVDELQSHQQQRKRSIPCAFVSLDHSVAIIQDNLRIQSEGTIGATAKVTRDKVCPVPTAEEDSKCEEYKQESEEPNDRQEDDVEGVCEKEKRPAVQPTASKHISSDHLDLPAVVRSSSEDESSSCNIDTLPQTYSSHSLIKPQSEILESDPPGQIISPILEIIPNDYEKELLHKLKYSPFDPELLAEVGKLSTEGRRRLDALSQQQESAVTAGASGRKSPSQSKYADSGTFTVEPNNTPTSQTSPRREPEKQEPNDDPIAEDDPDLNAYAKLTSPPPYRKSIMLTVDKSLERLRAMHAKSKASGSDDFEKSRLSKVVLHEKATLTGVKVRGSAAKAGDSKNIDRSTKSEVQPPPKKTTSHRSETFFLPSSTSMQSDEVVTPDSSMGSATSPEYYRKKINQSRSNFFQSLLPTSLLKTSTPSNSSGGAKTSLGSHVPSASSQNATSGSLYISSPRNKASSCSADNRMLTESSDALCDGALANAASQERNRNTHVLDHELESNESENAADTSVMCRQNSDMAASGESFSFVIQSEESNTPHVSSGLHSRPSGGGIAPADSERRPSRSTHPGSMAEKASAKRSQSASARLAKTFQKFFSGGSRPQTHRGAGGSSSSRNTASKDLPGSQKPSSVSNRGVDSSSSKGATMQLRQEKSVPADCSSDAKAMKNSSASDNEQLR